MQSVSPRSVAQVDLTLLKKKMEKKQKKKKRCGLSLLMFWPLLCFHVCILLVNTEFKDRGRDQEWGQQSYMKWKRAVGEVWRLISVMCRDSWAVMSVAVTAVFCFNPSVLCLQVTKGEICLRKPTEKHITFRLDSCNSVYCSYSRALLRLACLILPLCCRTHSLLTSLLFTIMSETSKAWTLLGFI